MRLFERTDDAVVEKALRGEESPDPALDPVARLCAELRDSTTEVPEEVARRHVAAILEEVRLGSDRDIAEVPHAGVPRRATHHEPRRQVWRPSFGLSGLFATVGAKVALGSVALAAATGGLAAAGALPQPAQDALSKAAAKVGFDLPAGSQQEEGDENAAGPDENASPVAHAVNEVVVNRDDYANGREFGLAVAEAAKAAASEQSAGATRRSERGAQKAADKAAQGSKRSEQARQDAPETVPGGQPESTGKPDGTPKVSPGGKGKPEEVPGGQPERSGKPDGTPGGPP